MWDSTSDVRYFVLPQRPEGTEGMSEPELAKLVTVDSLIGAGYALEPSQLREREAAHVEPEDAAGAARLRIVMSDTISKYKIGDAVMVATKIPPATRARHIIYAANAASSA